MKNITYDKLKELITEEKPDNEDEITGYALVSVQDHKTFTDEHIPGSINIPKGKEEEFEIHFDQSKEIIVYCGSVQCTASAIVADTLTKKGFKNVMRYEGGVDEWKSAGNNLEKGEGLTQDMRIA